MIWRKWQDLETRKSLLFRGNAPSTQETIGKITSQTERNGACNAWLCGNDGTRANLRSANLRDAILCGADLCGANLRDANLRGAKNIPFVPISCPDTGAFTAYKKAGGLIVKLLVTADAKRLSATGRKCRCDKAIVMSIENIDASCAETQAVSSDYDKNFIYRVGETVSVKDFCDDRWNECSAGIHFFVNRREAVDY